MDHQFVQTCNKLQGIKYSIPSDHNAILLNLKFKLNKVKEKTLKQKIRPYF